MDWTTFWPTLLATFIGVILSFLLTFAVYKVWDCWQVKRQRETTKFNLTIEITDNQSRLKNYERTINKVICENSKSRILYSYFPMQTMVYKAAIQNGEVYKLHDEKLQKGLYEYATKCECFNYLVSESKAMFAAKFGIYNDIPKEIVEAFKQEVSPDITELVEVSNKLIMALDADLTKDRAADKQISSE